MCYIYVHTGSPLLMVYLFILFIYLGFYVAFIQVISRRVVRRAEETSTYSSLGFCTVNCRPTASNYHLSHLRPCWESNPSLRGGRRECYHSATMAPVNGIIVILKNNAMFVTLFQHRARKTEMVIKDRILNKETLKSM